MKKVLIISGSPRSFYLGAVKEGDMPHNCLECGARTAVCPQGIQIPDVMQKLAAKIDQIKAERNK